MKFEDEMMREARQIVLSKTYQIVEKLVDEAWELHDKAETETEKEKHKITVMELLSKLQENEERLKLMMKNPS